MVAIAEAAYHLGWHYFLRRPTPRFELENTSTLVLTEVFQEVHVAAPSAAFIR